MLNRHIGHSNALTPGDQSGKGGTCVCLCAQGGSHMYVPMRPMHWPGHVNVCLCVHTSLGICDSGVYVCMLFDGAHTPLCVHV